VRFDSSARRDLLVRTIAIVNQKGGCGKTTTAINLAAVCARRGLRTLVVDMDPQSHCAAGLGVPENQIETHIGDALLSDVSRGVRRERLIWEVARNLDLLPSAMSLAGLEAPGGGLHRLEDRDRRLAALLRHLAPDYDRCFIDCPPTVGLLTFNALRAAGEAIIPVETGFFSLRGARRQWETIRHLVDRVNHPIACYVLPTLYNESQQIARDILSSIRRQFGGKVIPVVVRERPEVREAASFGQPVSEYAPDSEAVKDFAALAEWLDDHPADPPEIQMEITRTRYLPFVGEETSTKPTGRPEAPVGPAEPEPEFAAAPGQLGDGSRAAEMARRVRELAQRRTLPPEHCPAPAPPAPDPACDAEPTARPILKPADDDAPTPSRLHPSVIQNRDHAAHFAQQRRAMLIETKDVATTSGGSGVVRLYGVRQTSHGVLFVHPGAPGMHVGVAGSFNNWSPSSAPMRYNADLGAFELILPLAPGRYEYRLVVDGRWQVDPYNSRRTVNQFGGENNYFEVE